MLVKQAGVNTHVYSYGTVYELLYGGWRDFVRKDSLKGIKQSTYQMIAPMLMQHPELGGELPDAQWDGIGALKTSYGMCPDVEENPYVADMRSWQDLRAKYRLTSIINVNQLK